MLTTTDLALEQGENEEFVDFVTRVEDSACERGVLIPMILADEQSPGIHMMTPLGQLELHPDPASPLGVYEHGVERAYQALVLAQKLHTAVAVVGAKGSEIRVDIRPGMCEEEAQDDYTRAHLKAYAG